MCSLRLRSRCSARPAAGAGAGGCLPSHPCPAPPHRNSCTGSSARQLSGFLSYHLLGLLALSALACLTCAAAVTPPPPLPSSSVHAAARPPQLKADPDLARYIDTFIGTINGGHVFPGATRPHGSVKAVADVDGVDRQGGYSGYGGPIRGFSSTHDSGTGGSLSLMNYHALPMTCELEDCRISKAERLIPQRQDIPQHPITSTNVSAARSSPGWFAIQLDNGVDAETTVTDHAVVHRFDYSRFLGRSAASYIFSADGGRLGRDDPIAKQSASAGATTAPPTPRAKNEPVLLFDVSSNGGDGGAEVARANFTLRPASNGTLWQTATITAAGTYGPSFGFGHYDLFACATVPGVERMRVVEDGQTVVPGIYEAQSPHHINTNSINDGAFLRIADSYLAQHDGVATMRIGISWHSVERACKFAEEEIPDYETKAGFDRVLNDGRQIWNRKLGNSLIVNDTGVDHDHLVGFYSSLYRNYIAPTNLTDDRPFWDTQEPYYDSWYCIWDTFRTTHPLFSILAPVAQSEMVRALIDIWRHEGWLPDCRINNCPGYSQGGANAETLLADSYVKGIRHNINWTDGLQAVLENSSKKPPAFNWYGRGAIAERKHHGFIPSESRRSNRRDLYEKRVWSDPKDTYNFVASPVISRHLEYAMNDVSVALIAAGEGKRDIYESYLNQSKDWRNIWREDVKSDGFSGFFQPRHQDGSWGVQDPADCSPRNGLICFLSTSYETYEASIHQYSFYVPHDMAALIERMGGHETFLRRLDHIWDNYLADIGDELSFLTVFQYNWAPGGYRHTVDRQLMIVDTYFNTTAGGLPGNDDSGATSGLYVFFSLGFMPVAGTNVYLLSTPLFPGYSITSELTGETARVITHGWDGAKKNKYIVKATLNGEPWTKPWFEHSFFLEGGTLELWLGAEPGADFGTRLDDLPPSTSTGGLSYEDFSKRVPGEIKTVLAPKTIYPDLQVLYVRRGSQVNSFLVFSMLMIVCFVAMVFKRLHRDQERHMLLAGDSHATPGWLETGGLASLQRQTDEHQRTGPPKRRMSGYARDLTL